MLLLMLVKICGKKVWKLKNMNQEDENSLLLLVWLGNCFWCHLGLPSPIG